MSTEQPRDETGKFLSADGAQEPTAEATDEAPKYKVTVEGQETEVSLDEALQGYVRRETFHKRMNEVTDARQALQREQEMARLQGSRFAGRTQDLSAGYPPVGGLSGDRPLAASSPQVPGAYPAMTVPPQQPAAPPAPMEPDGYVEGRQVMAALNPVLGTVQELRRELREQNEARMEEQRIQELAARTPGFDRARAEETFWMLPDHERRDLAMMPDSVRLELLHHRYANKSPVAQPAAEDQPAPRQAGAGTQPPPPPQAEGVSQQPVGSPPLSPPDPTDREAMANYQENLERRMRGG